MITGNVFEKDSNHYSMKRQRRLSSIYQDVGPGPLGSAIGPRLSMDERTSMIEPPDYFKPNPTAPSFLNQGEFEYSRKNSFMDGFMKQGNVFLVSQPIIDIYSNQIIRSNPDDVPPQHLMRFSNTQN